MAENQSLEDRLKSHAEAFNGLLSLIPAKIYYGQDNSDQWQRKKQTKAEARAAKMAKLDPANNKSALDVIQENEKKRKREEAGDDNDDSTEKPREGLKQPKLSKKQRTESKPADVLDPEEDDAIRAAKRDKRKAKRDEKKARKEAVQAERQAKREQKQQQKTDASDDEDDEDDSPGPNGADLNVLDTSGLVEKDENAWESANSENEDVGHDRQSSSAATSSSKADSPAFDFSAQPSGTSSVSSTGTTEAPVSQKNKGSRSKPVAAKSSDATPQPNSEPTLTMEEKQERLRKRIAELRAARKADVNGQPAKTRAELLESRRQKQETRKEKKKALRQQAKEEEQRKAEEAMARGSPLMSPIVRSPPAEEEENNFAFGRVAFENGQAMTADLSNVLDLSKRKGPSDLKTAMLAANTKDARLAGLDEKKRADIAEKDMWLSARRKAHGEKPRDDTNLLKKALKRKDKQKEKSTNDWQKRIEGVKVGKEIRQKKREQNLAKRKEDKGKKSSKGHKAGGAKKQKKRPGFEGSFRAGGKR